MTMNPERRALLISALGCLVIGVVGLGFAALTGSRAILLDGLFNLSYFAAGLLTLKIAALLERPDDERFPFGYSAFEPLINGIKGTMVLGVSALALFDAVSALLSGGRPIAAGLAFGYGIFATIAGWSLAWFMHRAGRRLDSPLVHADGANWLVNAAVSSAVALAFAGIFLIRGTALEFLAPYVDPALVTLVVLISIGVPIRMAWDALMQLLGRATEAPVRRRIVALVEQALADLPDRRVFIRSQPLGRTTIVLIHVILPPESPISGLPHLDEFRRRVYTALAPEFSPLWLEVSFTADERWGIPQSPGAISGAL